MRRHVSYANVAATLALVLSMSGAAVAAKHYLINSTSQINPKVLKKLKGNRGPAGAPGTAGAPGATGSAGKEGPKGEPGPSETFEADLSQNTPVTSAGATRTVTLSGLPAGAYIVSGKASVLPAEHVSAIFGCYLHAESDVDASWIPLSTVTTFYASVTTELTHTFPSTGTVTMSCVNEQEKWQLVTFAEGEEAGTRIVATRVGSQHKSAVPAG